MAGYSRENKRQNEALQSILDGGVPEKRIFVAIEDKEEKKARHEHIRKEREEANKRSDSLKEARMPWFCPECDKVMKKRLDDRWWYLYGHCFGCQIKIENKMRIDGIYDEWAEKKVIANKLSWVKEQKEQLKEYKKQKGPEFYNQINPDGHSVEKEKWNMDMGSILKYVDEALEYLQKIEDSLK